MSYATPAGCLGGHMTSSADVLQSDRRSTEALRPSAAAIKPLISYRLSEHFRIKIDPAP